MKRAIFAFAMLLAPPTHAEVLVIDGMAVKVAKETALSLQGACANQWQELGADAHQLLAGQGCAWPVYYSVCAASPLGVSASQSAKKCQ